MATGRELGSHRQASARCGRPVAVALLLGCCAHWAAAADQEPVQVAALQLPRLEIDASSPPRFDSPDRASRLDLTLLPARRSGLGLSLGMNSVMPGLGSSLVAPGVNAGSVDLGLHWRYTLDSHYRFDVTAWRRTPNADAISLVESRDPSYGARVEMRMGSTSISRGFVADKGFVGFQLESGARISVKRSGGKPMIYYRNTF